MQRLRGWLTVWILPFAAIVASAAVLVISWDRYPDPLAVHWGFSGEPDGTLPLWLYAVAIIAGMLLSWTGLINGSRDGPNAPLASFSYFIIALLGAINLQILYFNLDATTWEDARDQDVLTFTGVLVIALLAAALGWLLGGGRRGVPQDVPLDMPATTATAWSSTASNPWMAVIAVVPIGLALVVTPIWAGLMVLIAILIAIFAFVRVGADENGVEIALGPLGRPRRKISIDRITGAGAIELKPMAYGGWGWRIRPGRRAYIIRGGAAIRIERANGVAVIVTVDGAPEGAAVIDSLARSRKYG
ncbi:MAG: hypothetical protein BMS9Abin07_0545 [Acidimicrobiia bacterium]|nr:MAG: hypothetical protein BMS9Abin07_0545 [Acidimicrobiia bacterium]